MLQLADGLGLDLADAFAGHLEDAAHLFQGVGVTVTQAVTQLDNLALAVGERLEDHVDLVLEHLLRGRVDRAVAPLVLDEIAKVAVFTLADGPIEADRVPRDLEHATRFLEAYAGRFGRLFDRRLASFVLEQLLAHLAELRHRFDHVDRDADRTGLIGNGPGDRLANPPRRVSRELVTAAILILVDRPHQARVPFLDQVEEAQAPVAVLLGDRHDEPQVAARQLLHRVFVARKPRFDARQPLAEAFRS